MSLSIYSQHKFLISDAACPRSCAKGEIERTMRAVRWRRCNLESVVVTVNLTRTSLRDNPFMHITVLKVAPGYRTSRLIKFNIIAPKFKIACSPSPTFRVVSVLSRAISREST